MSNDNFSEVTHESWLSRLGSSLVGVLIGLALLILSFPLLFWNEGRSVKEYRSLSEGAKVVVPVSADTLSPTNTGKLVHVSGPATGAKLTDAAFAISADALKLRRTVEVFQWQESKTSESKSKLGGGQETRTNYSYEKTWSSALIASKDFKQPAGHENPTALPYPQEEKTAPSVKVGAFALSTALTDQLGGFEPLPISESTTIPSGFKIAEGTLFKGVNTASPQVGDVRVRFEIVKPGVFSVVAQQSAQGLEPHPTRAGNPVALIESGTHSASEMFKTARTENNMLTWVLRGLGFLMMLIGLLFIFLPLRTVADVVPFIGSVVGAGVGLVCFLIALSLTSVTVAIAWIVHRPLLGIGLLALAIGGTWLIRTRLTSARRA